jgi:haloacetate dehalogenase
MLHFESSLVDAGETAIHVERGGAGPAVLLLHGFPETLAMWREIASLLAERFSLVCADLRGYGASGCPPSTGDHAPYSKRALARDMVAVMSRLGFERFSIAGHDRGGRVAYRAALDAPERVERIAVLDVVPIDTAWDRADDRLALGFWPWSLLAQPEPLPERLIGAAPEAVIDHALSEQWGTPADTFDERTRGEYLAQLRDTDHIHAICEEYRAAATLDYEHDEADRGKRRITCPTLALWSHTAAVAAWYEPLEVWKAWADQVEGGPISAGHFIPEEAPDETTRRLFEFLG